MAKIRLMKNGFTAGEVSPRLLGRSDLRAYANGAAVLTNVHIHPTGGLSRRPGLRYVTKAPKGDGRMIAFEFNTEQVYLLLFSDYKMTVYKDDKQQAVLYTPWSDDHLKQLNWTQSGDTLLVVHPDIGPRKITRTSHTNWKLDPWSFCTEIKPAENIDRLHQPYYKFANDTVTLKTDTTDVGTVTEITASEDIFTANYIGSHLRYRGKELLIEDYSSPKKIWAKIKETLPSSEASEDWEEQAFSAVRGWPCSVCFHQDRMVIGGSRDLPNRLWISKSSDLFNFDFGSGLDDEAIEFVILSDQINAIRAVFSGRHLQVFTSGGEWMLSGDPITPSKVQIFRQTRIGSSTERTIPPRNIDGATLFIARNRQELREFVYTDLEQAYQSNNLAMLADHLLVGAVDQDFDCKRRLLYIVQDNGEVACLTFYRTQGIVAWSRLQTDGHIKAVAVVGEKPYFLVKRATEQMIEVFDEKLFVDSAIVLTKQIATTQWHGLDCFNGRTVKLVADGRVQPDRLVKHGTLNLPNAVKTLNVGLPYEHEIRPLPPSIPHSDQTMQGARVRLIWVTFRLQDTGMLCVDVGKGFHHIPFRSLGKPFLNAPMVLFSGDKTIRACGWRRGSMESLWHIRQDTPHAFHLLSVTAQVAVNN